MTDQDLINSWLKTHEVSKLPEQQRGYHIAIDVHLFGTQMKDGRPAKGNVSVYGLQKYPVTLYPDQWLALLDRADEIRRIIRDNKDRLSWSGGHA